MIYDESNNVSNKSTFQEKILKPTIDKFLSGSSTTFLTNTSSSKTHLISRNTQNQFNIIESIIESVYESMEEKRLKDKNLEFSFLSFDKGEKIDLSKDLLYRGLMNEYNLKVTNVTNIVNQIMGLIKSDLNVFRISFKRNPKVPIITSS